MRTLDNKSFGISNTLFSAGKQGGSGGYAGNQQQPSKKKKVPLIDEDEILSAPPIQPPFDLKQIRFLKP